jgi:hypothetical protein
VDLGVVGMVRRALGMGEGTLRLAAASPCGLGWRILGASRWQRRVDWRPLEITAISNSGCLKTVVTHGRGAVFFDFAPKTLTCKRLRSISAVMRTDRR